MLASPADLLTDTSNLLANAGAAVEVGPGLYAQLAVAGGMLATGFGLESFTEVEEVGCAEPPKAEGEEDTSKKKKAPPKVRAKKAAGTQPKRKAGGILRGSSPKPSKEREGEDPSGGGAEAKGGSRSESSPLLGGKVESLQTQMEGRSLDGWSPNW